MLVLRGARVRTDAGWAEGDLVLDGPRVAATTDGAAALAGASDGTEVLDVTGCLVVPGLVDLHVHAAGGHALQGPRADLDAVAGTLARGGVTRFLATAHTAPLPELVDLCRRVADVGGAAAGGAAAGLARCVGVHLEGPWLSPAAAGAQPVEHLRPVPPAAGLAAALAPLLADGALRRVTLAPELPGALDLVTALCDAGVAVSVGHTTATYEQVRAAVQAGASGITHCYNAMPPLQGRAPGPVGAALDPVGVPGLVVEVIADGVHVHRAAVTALLAARGPRGVALVSDGVDGCGRPDGSPELVRDGTVLRLPDGILAGSALPLLQAVRTLVAWGVPLDDALDAASTTPARTLGVDVSLRPGADADLLVLTPDLRLRAAFVAGRPVPDVLP